VTRQRDQLADRGVDTTALDARIEALNNSEDARMQAICVRQRISREQLDEIIGEGDAGGWGNR
jgi:hypothetical protein